MYCKVADGECIGEACEHYSRWDSLGDLDYAPYCKLLHEFYPQRGGSE